MFPRLLLFCVCDVVWSLKSLVIDASADLFQTSSDQSLRLDETTVALTKIEDNAEAASIFLGLAGWDYKGVHGDIPLSCGEEKYVKFLRGIGSGYHGVTVLLEAASGEKVVAKVFTHAEEEENLSHECNMAKILEEAGVPNIVRCKARRSSGTHDLSGGR